jgi:hypothetical protein
MSDADILAKLARWAKQNPDAVAGDHAGEELLDLVRSISPSGVIPDEPQEARKPTKTVYVKRWRTLVELPEKYADEIVQALREPQRVASPDIEARITVLSDALKSISKNTCCDNCQEAARVARSALGAYVGLARTAEGGKQ